jgi:predicted nucleic acid-binding protein
MSSYLVIDASVSLKWALDDEEAVSQAVALRDGAIAGGATLIAPSLWFYEVINGLVTAVRRERLTPEQSAEALEQLLALSIRLADPPAEEVHKLALRYALAAYDAAYLALAETLGTELWTGDRPFYEKTRDRVGSVRWIGDFEGFP